MIEIDVPGVGPFALEHLVLDVNGTIAVGGGLIQGVAEAVEALGAVLHVVAITADTHGTASRLRELLGIDIHVISPGAEGAQKLAFIRELGVQGVVAIGNGANDVDMLGEAALGIAVIGGEGANVAAVIAADVVTTSVLDALAMLAQPARISAALRR
ncbi:MAG: ATPase P [Actinobacteria bacterium HGW-Actinobacteria-7]|jgi:soluble P-type ATPase|nr:MAG: ATPase P [Actinobacteria bacterium HGW-Actinobacteria-7]